jgi:hypothetical protein
MLLSACFRSCFPLFLLLLGACSAPRSITHSGMVTPRGEVKAGGNLVVNVASETAYRVGRVTKDAVSSLLSQDTIRVNAAVEHSAAAAVSYALDPTGFNYDFYLRVGLAKRLDAGYKYAFGAQCVDAMFQFLGEPPLKDGTDNEERFFGSIGLQYSWQKADLPSVVEKLSPVLQFSATRKDLLVPLVFSYSFGPKEEYGHLGFGAVYQRSFLRYSFGKGKLYEEVPGQHLVEVPEINERKAYNAWGIFVNGKVGYRKVYFLPALTMYYQRYGDYKLPGSLQVKLSGVTVVPSLGLQLWFGKNRGTPEK